MECEEDEVNNEALNTLFTMFAGIMCPDTIRAVVESCGDDLNLSIDAIMNMTGDDRGADRGGDNGGAVGGGDDREADRGGTINGNTSSSSRQPSYASASGTRSPASRAISKQMPKTVISFWTDQIREIIANHNQGNRILVLMRGVPGCGKSHLAKQCVETMIGATPLNYRTHIFSTDDYFMVRGQYQFIKYNLSEAHVWNQNRVKLALAQGLSPVIVDNTNIEPWELEPYMRAGIANGYIIEVLEPNTPWAKKPSQLVRKNIHNVPIANIKRMLENYSEGITAHNLMRSLRLSYPSNMVPPVKRLIPALPQEQEAALKPNDTAKGNEIKVNIKTENELPTGNVCTINSQVSMLETIVKPTECTQNAKVVADNASNEISELAGPSKEDDTGDEPTLEDELKQKLIMEAQKKFEEISNVEREWENGDNWDDNDQRGACAIGNASNSITEPREPKPQRSYNMAELGQPATNSLMLSESAGSDWSKISLFMPKWEDKKTSIEPVEPIPVETTSTSTCMEIGDQNVNGKCKVISATSRNINEFYIPLYKEKIPQTRKLDKGTITYEQDTLTETVRCKNAEKHFVELRKFFSNVPRAYLRDIFDHCHGDVNWAVNTIYDGMSNSEFTPVVTEELSDIEDCEGSEDIEECDCLSLYNIIPDYGAVRDAVTTTATATTEEASIGSPTLPKKSKKYVPATATSMLVKRQIEQNVVIADSHYSEHCLKIRKMRRGEFDEPSTSATPDAVPPEAETAPPLDSNTEATGNNDDESSASACETEKNITITLGNEMIRQIDETFGRHDMEYPDYIVPQISIPLSIYNLINAAWMESVFHQMEHHTQLSAEMIRQDEEFARQLVLKEEEMATAGTEPAVPDFKEIMDLDLALNFYQKEVDEWRNDIPNDMAAKMSRDKLFNLFPDIEQATLTELMAAHEHNFQLTVEVLLVSIGRADVLQQENGVNKFVMEKELQRQEKILEKEIKALTEEEWPLLTKDQVVDMSTVNNYRAEAEKHLQRRNTHYNKAREYMSRGATQVASYYSELAAFHKQKFEQASSMAAVSLMHVHAMKSADSGTIDLHYLRVSEASEAMDMFIDTHIQRLRESQLRGGARMNTLFFITGRGAHSPSGPRVKPAMKLRLLQRGLSSQEANPGLLYSKVTADDILSYQVPSF